MFLRGQNKFMFQVLKEWHFPQYCYELCIQIYPFLTHMSQLCNILIMKLFHSLFAHAFVKEYLGSFQVLCL